MDAAVLGSFDFGAIRDRLGQIRGGFRPPDHPAVSSAVPDGATAYRVCFPPGKITINDRDGVLDRAAAAAERCRHGVVSIHAYADPSDNHWSPMLLGAERGLMVRHALMSRGVEGNRIEVVSYGITSQASSEDGNNRRAEITVATATNQRKVGIDIHQG